MKKYEEAEQQEAYLNAYQMIIQDPTNNLLAAKQILYKKIMPQLTDEEIEQIIAPQDQGQMPAGVPQNEQELMGVEAGPMPELGVNPYGIQPME